MTVSNQNARIFFQGDSVSTTGYIYNSSEGNNATTGWINVKTDEVLIQIGCGTLLVGNGALQYRIEGKFDTLDRAASISVGSFAQSESIDRVSRVTSKVKQIRVGARLSTMVSTILGSPNNFYAAVCLTELK
uniref:Uncharacterized protein n=1 Tax=viral metagenome TaxID=1070528 RepID=A0A6H1ZLI6_9ZZZZ